jgi:putative (di)nucleoside polyphosphate hydrolase
MGKDMKDLLLFDLGHFGESYWRSEEVGEKRLNFFIGLVTAVAAGLAAFVGSEVASKNPGLVAGVTSMALAGLLVVGLATYLRILKRNDVTDEYIDVLKYLRKSYVDLEKPGSPEICYRLPLSTKPRSVLSGGQTTMVAAINCVVIACALAIAWPHPTPKLVAVACGFSAGVVLHLAARRLRQLLLHRDAPRSAEFFRASVGAMITDGQGYLLAFERKDKPGSRQFMQGGIEKGESPLEALEREIGEESGIRMEELEPLAEFPGLLTYELPPEHRSKKTGLGQTQRWFLLSYKPGKQGIELPAESEFRSCEWMTFEQLFASGKVVDFRRDVYSRLRQEFGDKV